MAGGFPLGTRLELGLDEWVDVTDRVYARDPISISRGRAADASSTDPASCRFTLDNRDNRFSMRNPTGPYFGALRRNVPVRVSLPAEVTGMLLRYNNPVLDRESGAFTPGVGLASTGDLDVRVEIDADQWQRGHLAGKYQNLDGLREWVFIVDDGRLWLQWSPDGLAATQVFARSKVLSVDSGPAHMAVRAVLTLSTGTVTFYTADTLAGPWTLFDTVVGSGARSIVVSDAGIELGNISAFLGQALPGRMIGAEIRRGSTLVASPDFSAQDVGTLAFADAQGNTWTLGADAEITDRDVRFYGEVSQWPQSRDVAGVDKTIAVTAYGQRRRLSLNAPALDSPMVREFDSPKRTAIVAYWPMEDAAGASKVASAFPGAPAMNVYGAPEFAVYPDWASSKPLPKMRTGAFIGSVPAYDASDGVIQLRVFMDMDTAPTTTTNFFTLRTSTMLWDVDATSLGQLRVRALSSDEDTEYTATALINFDMASRGFTSVNFLVQQVGSDVTFKLQVLDFQNDEVWNQSIPVTEVSGTVTGRNIGRATQVTIARDQALGDVAIGHLAIANAIGAYANTGGALNTWNGESAEERLARLSREDGITVRLNDAGGFEGYRNGHHLGDQVADTWLALLDQAEESDLGLLFEPRDELGFTYRTRWSLVNQPVRLYLDYDAGEIAGVFQPVDDDDALENDITVKRTDGGSARAEDTESALSVLPPPFGVGRYSDEVEISAQSDEWLPSQAAFRLRLGTVDAARYPTLSVDLHGRRVSDDQARRVRALDIGDRIDILNADEWTADVPQLVTGYVEELQVTTHRFTFNVTPGDPWTAAVVDSGDRYDTAGSELAAPPPPTPVAPSVVASAASYQNLSTVVVPTVAGARVVACLAWNTLADIHAPAGWSQLDMTTETSAQAATFEAAGGVADWTFTFTDPATGLPLVSKTAMVAVGLSSSAVSASVGLADAGTDGTHEAPALVVPAGPARLLRFYWDKASTTTAWTANDVAATEIQDQAGTGGGSASMAATSQAVSAGTVPAASATANALSGQAGGFSVALVSVPDPSDPDGSVSETDTTLNVATTLGPIWTTTPAEFPFDVVCGGERMTVTTITGTTSPQTFTVIRSVNGVVKGHAAGSAVALADPSYSTL